MKTLRAIFRTPAALRLCALAMILVAWATSLAICLALKHVISVYFF